MSAIIISDAQYFSLIILLLTKPITKWYFVSLCFILLLKVIIDCRLYSYLKCISSFLIQQSSRQVSANELYIFSFTADQPAQVCFLHTHAIVLSCYSSSIIFQYIVTVRFSAASIFCPVCIKINYQSDSIIS